MEAVQRAGAMGIIKGIGKSADWENKTFFYPDSTITIGEIDYAISKDIFDIVFDQGKEELVNLKNLTGIIDQLMSHIDQEKNVKFIPPFYTGKITSDDFQNFGLKNYDESPSLTRKEVAVILVHYIDWFYVWDCNLKGELTVSKE